MRANPRTFRCPNCNEMVNDNMQQCRYCNMPVDYAVARLIAKRQEKANQSYSDASYLRTAAVAMYVFMVGSYIPLIGWIFGFGFKVTFVVVLVLLIRWQLKFGGLVTNDADYLKARRSWRLSLVWWVIAIFLGFIIPSIIQLVVMLATR